MSAKGVIEEGSSVIGDMEVVGEPDGSVVISGRPAKSWSLRMLEAPKLLEDKVMDKNERW